MRTLVFLLEEPSARAMFEGVLPNLLSPSIKTQFMVFEGKQDLHKPMVMRMRHWRTPNSHFIVMRDQDSADCHQIRRELIDLCTQAGRPDALVRIACHELESFYLGDLSAVAMGLRLSGLDSQQGRRKFRNPDQLANAADELKFLTRRRYQKLSGSRAISCHLRVDGYNRSHSFNVLIDGIRKVAAIRNQ